MLKFNPELAVGMMLLHEHREQSLTLPIAMCIRCFHLFVTTCTQDASQRLLRYYSPLSYAVASELYMLGAKGCCCDVCSKPFLKE